MLHSRTSVTVYSASSSADDLHGIDLMFNKIPQSALYPLFLVILTAAFSWGSGGSLIFMGNILAATPDQVTCNTFIPASENDTYQQCRDECQGNESYHFVGDWTDETIVTKYGLFCERSARINDINTVNLAGLAVGAVAGGSLSDIFGRRTIMLLCCLLAGFVGLGTAALSAVSIYAFAVGRFLISALVHASNIVQYVYGLEQSTPQNRAILCIFTQCFFASGYMSLSLYGYILPNWQYMNYAISVWPMLLIFFIPAIPESYRWYLSQNRQEDGIREIKDYAKKCGVDLEDEFIKEIVHEDKVNTAVDSLNTYVYSIRDLFITPQLRSITLRMMVVYAVTSATYYALFLVKLPGSFLVNSFVMGLMEFLAMFPVALVINKSWCSRARLICILFTSLSIALFAAAICLWKSETSDDLASTMVRVLSLIGCALIGAQFTSTLLWAGELYPTVVRNCGLGFLSTTGRLASLLSPQIMKLALPPYSLPWLPYVIFGIMTVIAACVSITLPDTNGKELIQSVEDAEDIYSRRK